MKLHFTSAEFADRLTRTCSALSAAGLDALLIFKPESQYWLTGYDTFGYCFFQCLVCRADGRMVLLTRSADLRQAQLTSVIDDVTVWRDGVDARPVDELATLCGGLGLGGRRIGVEWDTAALSAASGAALQAALGDSVELVDASLLIARLRLRKSPAELAYIRRAATLADHALQAALGATGPGADEAEIKARMLATLHAGDGDDMANPLIIGSGPYALLCRSHSGRRRLDSPDQLTLEWAGVYRHYHAAQMRTVCVGGATVRHRQLFAAALEALLACEARLRAGSTVGEVYAAHADVLDRLGLGAHRLNACGYALGAVYPPSWMDWPMFYAGNPVVLEPDMVFFLHMILMDSETGTAMTLGRTSLVTPGDPEALGGGALQLLER